MSLKTKNHTGTSQQNIRNFSSMSLGSGNWSRTSRNSLNTGGCITCVTINETLLTPINLGIDPDIKTARSNEMNQIKDINNRFAGFIDKVRHLEQQNKMLETKWKLMQDQTHGPSNIEPMIQDYIRLLQKKLDQLNNDNGRLNQEKNQMDQCVKDMKTKYEDEINKRNKVENDFVLLKRDADVSLLSKINLEIKVKAMGEEIYVLKAVYGQELIELQSNMKETSAVVEMDNSRGLNMKQTLADINAQYEDIVANSREEVESWYKTKVDSLTNQAEQTGEELRKTRVEISEFKRLIRNLESNILSAKKQNSTLERQITELEFQRGEAVHTAKTKIRDLEAALLSAKQVMAQQIREYQDLMNIKLALDIEISTYMKLLEGEEINFGQQSITNMFLIPSHSVMPDTGTQKPSHSTAVIIKKVEINNATFSTTEKQ
ncbi:hypothetical protein UPYG_G00014830 [Umbra pygmaea]|uniref:IF rod domain-containing protein n=1 Tax=Umbra pygmaea TaxID=75934 RepID=A0ABD0Y3K5_UMBPY